MQTRVFNINLGYACDNRCPHCISHSTRKGVPGWFGLRDVIMLLEEYAPAKGDIVILSGGEPTLHPEFAELAGELAKTPARIFLYSNGRAFADVRFAERAASLLDRITLSCYGGPEEHASLSGREESHALTRQGLRNLSALREQGGRARLEVKIVASAKMIERKRSLLQVLDDLIENGEADSLVVSRVLVERNAEAVEGEAVHAYLGEELPGLWENRGWAASSTKLVDCLPCLLGEGIFSAIRAARPRQHRKEIFFFDPLRPRGGKLDLSSRAAFFERCDTCFARTFCGTTVTCYGALLRTGGNTWSHVPE